MRRLRGVGGVTHVRILAVTHPHTRMHMRRALPKYLSGPHGRTSEPVKCCESHHRRSCAPAHSASNHIKSNQKTHQITANEHTWRQRGCVPPPCAARCADDRILHAAPSSPPLLLPASMTRQNQNRIKSNQLPTGKHTKEVRKLTQFSRTHARAAQATRRRAPASYHSPLPTSQPHSSRTPFQASRRCRAR